MKQRIRFYGCLALLLAGVGSACTFMDRSGQSTSDSSAQQKSVSEDILVGTLNVAVDISILPLLKEQESVFLSAYPNTKLNFLSSPEIPAINNLLQGKADVAILTRQLSDAERAIFDNRSIQPRIFEMAYDALVFLAPATMADTTLNKSQLTAILKGQDSGKQLVFPELTSSSFRQLKEYTGVSNVSSAQLQTVSSVEEVLSSVAQSGTKIGVISFNEYLNAKGTFSDLNKIRILSVQNNESDHSQAAYYRPSQSSIAEGTYPLRRVIYVLNFQPNLGLGIGFSAFLTGDRGQRIVLKSGLVPATMPGREIIVRDKIN